MHFGHPRTTTAFKNQNFLKIWVFQGFPYTRLGPDLAILSPFWGIKFQNPCKKCPSHGEKNLKIFLFFKNVPNSPRKHFGHPKPIRNHQKPSISKIYQIYYLPLRWSCVSSRRGFRWVTYIYDVPRRVDHRNPDDTLPQITIYSKKTIYISYLHNF